MRFIINGLAIAALLAPMGLSAQAPDGSPACHGDLDGNQLTTSIEFPNGYVVEAPWVIDWNRQATMEDGRRGVEVGASLDRLVEVDPATGEQVVTPFPEPIETTFEGASEEELTHRAAQIWCLTVLKAQEQRQQRNGPQADTRRSSIRTTTS